jgi:hypothetical protein
LPALCCCGDGSGELLPGLVGLGLGGRGRRRGCIGDSELLLQGFGNVQGFGYFSGGWLFSFIVQLDALTATS